MKLLNQSRPLQSRSLFSLSISPLTLCLELLLCTGLAACKSADAPAKPTIPRPEASVFVKQKHCLACHVADAEEHAPLWPSIAEHYKGDPNAVSKLSANLLNGGSGSFGKTAMPPQYKNVTPDEAKYLVEWILKQK